MDTPGPATAVSTYVQIIVAAVTALPLVISPIIAWALSRSGVSNESATIDYLNKRLDFLERISKLQAQFAEGPMKPFVETEIEQYREFLREPPAFLTHREQVGASQQTLFERFFLIGLAPAARKRIFKGLFYFFFAIGIGFLILPFALKIQQYREYGLFTWLPISVVLYSVVFYLGIALLFRWAAR